MKPVCLPPLQTIAALIITVALLGISPLAGPFIPAHAMPNTAPAFSCNEVSSIPTAECNALVTLYNTTAGESWANRTGWLTTNTPCSWYGVTCSGTHVTQLRLQSNGLTGTLPVDLQDLTKLNWLELQYNSLSGPIPAELGLLSELTELALYGNAFTGEIPFQLSHLFNLKALRLGFNQLSGTVPIDLGNLSALTILGIDSNQLSGPLPEELGNLTELTLLNANNNKFSGPIPASFGNFPNMWRLWLENNQLSGELPSELGNLVNLKNFSVKNNALSGDIPASLTALTLMQKLDLGYNQLTATDGALISYLNSEDPDWASTQTIPPTNLQATVQSGGSVLVTWSPIAYVADGGGYEISYSTTPGGPYTVHGQTASKSAASYLATGLATNTNYYFVVRTLTPAHGDQQNGLTSSYSQEAQAQTSSFSCGSVAEIPQAECNALVIFFNSTGGANWTNRSGWLANTTPCSWFGILCAGGSVTELVLKSNGLKGTLPAELSTLSQLVNLDLNHNELSGSIPPQLAQLSKLTFLRLPFNQLSGSIPKELALLTNLDQLVLSQNLLSGPIPPELGNLPNLTRLTLSFNRLSGEIPTTLGNLTKLQRLALGRNELGGTIPVEIGNLTNLIELWMPENKLRDEVPASILNLVNLSSLDLTNNRFFITNPAVLAFVNSKQAKWAQTQTVAPTNLQATALSSNAIRLTWTPILYTEDGGYYEIRYATTAGGPYLVHGVTANKSANSYDVTGLLANTTYYFAVRTFTPAHGNQANSLWSSTYSNEATATTAANNSATSPEIISQPATTALRNQTYNYSVVANGGTPLSFALVQRPSGMAIDALTGLISWTPSTLGSFNVTARVSNAFGNREQSFVITVNEGPTITSEPVTTAALNQPYAYDVDATGSPAPTYALRTAPSGMTINATTGLIAWTPTKAEIVTVVLEVTNSVDQAEQEFTINVTQVTAPEAPQITSTPVTEAVVGQPYSYNVEATGKPSPQFTLNGPPAGMTINSTTGVINWMPTTAGSFNVTVVATNSAGNPTQSFTLNVTNAPTGDGYEDDDQCSRALAIPTTGAAQTRNFHDVNDNDWLKFSAQAGKTYIIQVDNIGTQADTVIALFNGCALAPAGTSTNAFGSTVTLEWDATRTGEYFVKLQHVDPIFAGATTEYTIAVQEDNEPPSAPKSPRCKAVNPTTLAIQWQQNPERDVKGYRVAFVGVVAGAASGNDDVDGRATTYYELGNLQQGQTTRFRVLAVDYSSNESAPSGQVECVAGAPVDGTQPQFTMNQPSNSTTVTTTAALVTFSGAAQDPAGNLSRATVRNNTNSAEKSDFSLTGGADEFRVEDVPLAIGNNSLTVAVTDDAGNQSTRTVNVRRLGQSTGAVIIIAGRNETQSLQTNIYNSTNRAYRIFKSAGFSDDDIFYIAPVEQRPEGDVNRVDATAEPAAVQQAITTWAQGKVGPGKPFTLYLMDHGFADRFCVDGCNTGGFITPVELDGWLRALENATGVDQVNVIIEACESGSFLDRHNGDVANSLSKQGRVIITSTGRDKNAYASAQGAYFSDAFFSCIADSGDLKGCFVQGEQAVTLTGVNQTPWLDDNGDGLYNASDGAVAQGRFITRFFNSVRPQITTINVTRDGVNGTLTATVEEGAEDLELVWAAVYPPGFQEPSDVTLNLQVPTVRLEPVANTPGQYRFDYVNGFPAQGDYRIVFYAQDRLGINALPRTPGDSTPQPTVRKVYLPLVAR